MASNRQRVINETYDVRMAFARIEDELIASMMRNLSRHHKEEDKEQFDWIKKNFHMQWILVFSMVWGFASMLVMGLSQSRVLWGICCAVIWLTLAVIIIVYRLLREMNSKKPLVFTPRVKRMVACIIIIALLMLLIPSLLHL